MIKQLALLVAIIVLGSSAGDAAAKSRPFKVSDYPIEVRKTLSLGPVTCREVAGGGKVGFSRNTVRRVDFNGDGIKDYIVSFENTTCGSVFVSSRRCIEACFLVKPGNDAEGAHEAANHRQGSTRIFVCFSGLPRSANACATPSMPTLPVISEAASTLPSASSCSELANSVGV